MFFLKLWTGLIDSEHSTYEFAMARAIELYELNPSWASAEFPVGYIKIVEEKDE